MKKAVFLSMLFVSLVLSAFSQPLIDQNDMPNIGDTIRVNISISTNGVDYTSSGSNHLWDFSYNVSIPSMGYYGEKKHRVNYVLGKNIKNIGNKEFPAGFHYLPFTTGDLQKGIYFIRISDDSVTKVLKLQVL